MLTILALALSPDARARPTDGGRWSYDDTDTVATVRGPNGAVTVWYSSSGTNAVKPGDADANGVPDFAEEVAATTEDVLDVFAQAGFRAPISDGTRGGDATLDVYLVDFGGDADGAWTSEGCDGDARCTGHFVMENDFVGYGYGSLTTAIRTLTSHELFHGVQAAYDSSEPNWYAEGTATWAEALYDPDSQDFVRFCDAYLEDAGRSLDEPPAAPVPTFAYATALWWWFLADRHGTQLLVDLVEATDGADGVLPDMEALEINAGSDLRTDWTTFASLNLATGNRAGVLDGYPFASRIGPVRAEESGPTIDDENRYYPLATTYYAIEHGGGPMSVALAAAAPELAFAVHPEDTEGRVLPAVASFDGAETVDLGDLPAGTYWLVGSNPTLAESSTRVRTCVGPQAWACVDGALDTGDAVEDTGLEETPAGCEGCATGAGAPALPATTGVLGAVLPLWWRSRRRRVATRSR